MRVTKLDIHGQERVHLAWEARSPNGFQEAYDMAARAREAFVSELEGFLQRQVPQHLQLGADSSATG
jgi:hypothetical protein